MNFEERALSLRCNDSWMYGILSLPEQAASRGVLIVVGGPQYRVGSHRQFTLLARHLASLRIPVLRFDCRGMEIAKALRELLKIWKMISAVR